VKELNMARTRTTLVAGGLLAGALLLGATGLVSAQGPASSPVPGWQNMMGSQGGQNMMGGQGWQGMQNMMGGQGWQGMQNMMGGAMGSMNPAALDADTLAQMQKLHDTMVANGTVDWGQMQKLHDRIHGAATPSPAPTPSR